MAGNHHPESRSAAAANTSATAAPPPIVLDLLHWCQCQPLEIININIRKARSIPRRGLATVVELKLKAHRHSDEIFSLLQFALRLPTPFVRAVAIPSAPLIHAIPLDSTSFLYLYQQHDDGRSWAATRRPISNK